MSCPHQLLALNIYKIFIQLAVQNPAFVNFHLLQNKINCKSIYFWQGEYES